MHGGARLNGVKLRAGAWVFINMGVVPRINPSDTTSRLGNRGANGSLLLNGQETTRGN